MPNEFSAEAVIPVSAEEYWLLRMCAPSTSSLRLGKMHGMSNPNSGFVCNAEMSQHMRLSYLFLFFCAFFQKKKKKKKKNYEELDPGAEIEFTWLLTILVLKIKYYYITI
jgi:hypothetical protein